MVIFHGYVKLPEGIIGDITKRSPKTEQNAGDLRRKMIMFLFGGVDRCLDEQKSDLIGDHHSSLLDG